MQINTQIVRVSTTNRKMSLDANPNSGLQIAGLLSGVKS